MLTKQSDRCRLSHNVDKGVTKEMANAVMASLYGSDEYSAKKAKNTSKKPAKKAGKK